jgi:pyruvate/2-oxoglutarate dehydrogenase complex dihydrolipoamide acyltransferase (E2) component
MSSITLTVKHFAGLHARPAALFVKMVSPVTGTRPTISNLGMFWIEDFHAIINPPQSAVLAVGAIVKRPVAVGDLIGLRP